MSEDIRGEITALNERGLKFKGDDEWLNFTKPEWRKEPWDDVTVGDTVKATVNDTGYVIAIAKNGAVRRSARAPKQAPVKTAPVRVAPRVAGLDKDAMIARHVALKAAVALLPYHEAWLKADYPRKLAWIEEAASRLEGWLGRGDDKPATETEPFAEFDDEPPPWEEA